MLGDWRYKVLDVPAGDAVRAITEDLKQVIPETGDSPVETTLHGRLGDGLYAYTYPLPLDQLRMITDDCHSPAGGTGTLLKHKPENESLLGPSTAVSVTARIEDSVICTLDRGTGEELIEWIRDDY